NPAYYPKSHYRHYMTTAHRIYIGRMVDLFMEQKNPIKKLAFNRLNNFCDVIYIDEAQDFVGKDYDILKRLFSLKAPFVLSVGDFNQHSVSRTNFNTARPFKKNKKD